MNLKLNISIPVDLELLSGESHSITVKSQDIKDVLYEVCCSQHSSCNDECPVYFENGSKVPIDKNWQNECSCFKDGGEMLEFLRKKYQRGVIS